MLVDASKPSAHTAVHFVCAGEKVGPHYVEAVPEVGSGELVKGYRLMPVPDLVRMKLTSDRLKDRVHIQDMDEVGLITSAIEAGLSPILRERLAEIRATE